MIHAVSGTDTTHNASLASRTVHMVIKTNALIYDDRFRKEVQSLTRMGCRVSASIVEDANIKKNQHSYEDGVEHSFHVLSLVTRKLVASRIFVLFHLIEFVLRACWHIARKRPNVVWIHDPILLVFMPVLCLFRAIGLIERIVWDQHELPVKRIDSSKLLRTVFGTFCRGADYLVAANQQRLDYLAEHYSGVRRVHGAVIRNFSDAVFVEQPVKPLPEALQQWLNGREYFLVQSGLVELRQFRAVAETIIPNANLPVIVAVGGGNTALIDEYRERFGTAFDERVYLIGKVPQMELTRYLDSAVASLIFYQQSYGINNWLCEPNRLFQALNRSVPVIVGNNPPMREILNSYPLGQVTDDDGTNAKLLSKAIQHFMERREHIEPLSSAQRLQLSWASQDATIQRLVA